MLEEVKNRHNRNIQSYLCNENLLDEQRGVMLKFNKEMEMNEGLSVASRRSALSVLHCLSLEIQKPYEDITKEDIEKYLYNLDIKPSTMKYYKIIIRKFFKWLYQSEEYPDVVKWIKLNRNKKRKLPEDILTPEEVKRLINAVDNPRDQAIIALLYDSGCRVGEIVTLKQKDVKMDQYGAVVIVNGKTGMRRLRLIDSVPYLTQWINCHPNKGDNNYLFVSKKNSNKPLTDAGVQRIFRLLSKNANLGKRVHPHLLRHSRLTHLAKDFTESELKIIAGWTGDSKMPGVYVHLSGADVENKILEKAGLKDKEEREERDNAMRPKECPRCGEQSPATAMFCPKCGAALSLKTAMALEESAKPVDDNLTKLMDTRINELVEARINEILGELK